MGWWVADALAVSPVWLFAWLWWVPFSIVLHELGHGFAAIWQGDETPIVLDRITLNPLVHMGTTSLLVFLFIGVAWGVMPVTPARFRMGRTGEALVAFAGPLVNLVLALLCLTAAAFWIRFGPAGSGRDWVWAVETFLTLGGLLNFALLVLNLLPIPPLDGSTILRSLSWRVESWYNHPNAQTVTLGILLLVFFFGGRFIWGAADTAAGVVLNGWLRLLG